MGNQQFDERYPAMFQPGGEAVPAAVHRPATSPTTPDPGVAPAGLGPAEPASPATAESDAAPANSPRLLLRVPTIVGGVLLLMGALLPWVPYWVVKPSGLPEDYYLGGAMWSYVATQAAAPMICIGLGILAMVFFVYVQQHQTRREGLRRVFTIASAAVLAAGLYAQFAHLIHPPLQHENADGNTAVVSYYESPSAYVSVLGMVAFGPLFVGFLMLAGLAVSRNFSPIRGYAVGLLFVAAAAFAQFSQYLLPDVPPIRQSDDEGFQGIPGWSALLPMLMPALVAAGVIVMACAALGPAVAAAIRTPRAVPWAASKVEQADEAGSAVEQVEDHAQPEL